MRNESRQEPTMKVFWKDDAKTILVREFSADWSFEDFENAIARMRQMLTEVSHHVYIVIDASQVQQVPAGAMGYFHAANQNLPSHVKMRILVTRQSLLQSIFKILLGIAPQSFGNFYIVSSLDAAYKKISLAQTVETLD
jgi:hypothetical protein